MDAVVYTTNTGFTEKYAHLVGNKTGLPVYSLKWAEEKLRKDSQIIYLGWVMADKIQGYKNAEKRFNIRAVCAVGMSATGTRTEAVRKANRISDDIPLFTLQGGYDITKLHGLKKVMLKIFLKIYGKKLKEKKNRTADDELMLDLMENGGSRVSTLNLTGFFRWFDNYR